MPTFFGKYEAAPAVAKYQELWLELVRANLPASDLPRYARELQSLFARFLDERTAPSLEEVLTVTGELLDDLRDASHDADGRYVDDGHYLQAARHLQHAQRLAHEEQARVDRSY